MPPQRLYLPGNECIYVITGYDTVVDPNATATATTVAAAACRLRQPRGAADDGASGLPRRAAPPATVQVPVYSRVDSGTTIPPNVLDPRAPLNTVPLDYRVAAC